MFDFVLCLIALVMHYHILFDFDCKFPFDCFEQNLHDNLTLTDNSITTGLYTMMNLHRILQLLFGDQNKPDNKFISRLKQLLEI